VNPTIYRVNISDSDHTAIPKTASGNAMLRNIRARTCAPHGSGEEQHKAGRGEWADDRNADQPEQQPNRAAAFKAPRVGNRGAGTCTAAWLAKTYGERERMRRWPKA